MNLKHLSVFLILSLAIAFPAFAEPTPVPVTEITAQLALGAAGIAAIGLATSGLVALAKVWGYLKLAMG